MVPYVALPLATPLTVQVTAVLELPVTDAVNPRVPLTDRLWGLEGVVMVIPTTGVMVTDAEADLVVSAALVAVMVTLCGVGTVAGAV
jgi:hypothetical protein